MQVVNFTEARKNLKSIFDDVYHNSEAVVVNRKNAENVVIISLDRFNAIDETAYLLGSEANKKHLLSSINELRKSRADKPSKNEDWIDRTFAVMSDNDAEELLEEIQTSRVNKEIDLWS
jgi:antitoxin YefM